MVGTIICDVSTIMCDISTINVRFHLLEIPYPYGYCRITLKLCICQLKKHLWLKTYIFKSNKISG